MGWTMKADNVVSGSIADTRVFELRPEAYHEHALEACAQPYMSYTLSVIWLLAHDLAEIKARLRGLFRREELIF